MHHIPTISTMFEGPSGTGVYRAQPRAAVPLLALAPPALALGEEILGAGDEETNVRDFWNFISKASDIVKDGDRLENLAWRQWCRHRRDSTQSSASHYSHNRRVSTSSSGTTASSVSARTPHLDQPPSPTWSEYLPHPDKRTFGSALKLLLEEDQFIDWVSDAQRQLPPPTISVPDTPVAQLEIRLVEPTPVPSRVGSLGGSISGVGMLGIGIPHRLTEEPGEQEIVEEDEEDEETDSEDRDESEKQTIIPQSSKAAKSKVIPPTSRAAKKQSKFFLQSSPSKGTGSGSDTGASPNGHPEKSSTPPPIPQPPSPSLSLSPDIRPTVPKAQHRRTSSGSSASVSGPAPVAAAVKKRSPASKRHVSLSTMRGRFGMEKRKAAELLAQKIEAEAALSAAAEEEAAWEDEDGEEEEEQAEAVTVPAKVEEEDVQRVISPVDKGKGRAVEPELESEEEHDSDYDTEEDGSQDEEEGDGDWSDEASTDDKLPSRAEKAPSPSKKSPKPPPHPPPGQISPAPPNLRRTSSSKSANSKAPTSNSRKKSISHLDLTGLFNRPSARKNPSSDEGPRGPTPTPLKNMTRKQRLAAMEERKKIEAELEAQQKREMFAKQHIFGPKPTQHEGLLSGIFKRGGSMVDLTVAGTPHFTSPPIRSSPTLVHLPSMARSPNGPALLRSKSAVAVPVQTGVSVSRVSPNRSRLNEVVATSSSPEVKDNDERPRRSSDRSDKSGSVERRAPEGVELESDDSSSEEDDYLATSSTQRKLAELADKQARRVKGRSPEIDQIVAIAGPSNPGPSAQQIMQNGQGGVRFDVPGTVEPMTPTTRRRTIISREMSMSLRQNLLLEREKSSGGGRRTSVGPAQHSRPPPITHTSHLPTRNLSTADLGQYQMGAPLARHRSETALHRETIAAQQRQSPPVAGGQPSGQSHMSESPVQLVHPQPHRSTSGSVITINTRHRLPAHPLLQSDRPQAPQVQVHTQAPSPQLEQVRRRAQPSVLGGFLRPLTRVGTPAAIPEPARTGVINRTQSSANLTTARRDETAPDVSGSIEAPAMVRRSTVEGSSGAEWKAEVDRRRELARRSDSSYRVHGW